MTLLTTLSSLVQAAVKEAITDRSGIKLN